MGGLIETRNTNVKPDAEKAGSSGGEWKGGESWGGYNSKGLAAISESRVAKM